MLQPPTAGRVAPAVAIVGAGVGGLTAACELQRRGARVTVVERRHVGGCATTFPLGGMAYDAGATLAFGLDHPGLLGGVLGDLGIDLPRHRPEIAWSVRGEGLAVDRWVDRDRWLAEATGAFGAGFEALWAACESASDTVLAAAARRPPLPPTSAAD
jgi:phytoene dehydrogenase-like protein